MQTTLLGLAIAIILALVAALVAPFVVDWNHYRSAFETEASRLTGLTVHVNGAIDARILPTPVIKLRDVEIGEAGRKPQFQVGTLDLEVGLGPLLRGEIQASQLRLVAPQINLGLDRSGAIVWPAVSPSFHPEAFSVSRFNVEDGRVTLTDAASGSRVVMQKLWFNGDIRSVTGPFKGEGAAVIGDELYGYRISGNSPEGLGALKIRLGIDPSDHPLTADIDGTLTLDHGVPQFDGTLALSRPVGATLPSGQRVMSDPWHAGGRLQATPAAASLRDFAVQYGPDERAVNFLGNAKLTLGAHPHLDGTIAALQVDADRAVAAPDLTRRPPLLVIKNFFKAFVADVKPPVPSDIGISVDALTVGGTTIQSLHGNMRFNDAGWSLDDFEFRAPGLTQVSLSGRLNDTPQGVAFSGPATLQSSDVDSLVAWLKGRSQSPAARVKPLSARGDLTVATDRIAVDRLAARLDQENLEGRLAYTWATADRPPVLDADLRAAALDLDALSAFAKAAVADDGFELPHAGTLALDIGKATFAGVDARAVNAHLKFDAGALQIDRLSVGALGGAAVNISGRIDELSSQPRGSVTFDLDARALGGVADVLGRFAPQAADAVRRFADRLAPAKVHATLTVARAASAGSTAKLDLGGQMGAMRVALNGDATGDPSHFDAAAVHLKSEFDADDGTALAALLGLDQVLGVDRTPGRLVLQASGPLNGELHVDGHAVAAGFDIATQGALRLSGESGPTAKLQVQATAADLRPLQKIMTGQPGAALPVSGRAALAVAGSDLSFTDATVTIGKASLHGRLDLALASPVGINGDVESENADATAVAALLLGAPRSTPGSGALWASTSFGSGAFAAVNGAVTFRLDHAAFAPGLDASGLKGVARFRRSEIALDNIDGSLAGGRLTGELSFRRDMDVLAAHGSLALANADAAVLLGVDRKAIDGRVTMKLQGDATGASPLGLVGVLHGSGSIAMTNASFGGFDAAAFDAAVHASDLSGSIDATRVQTAVGAAMANGRIATPYSEAPVTITGGKVSLAKATLEARDGVQLSLAGVLDLGNEQLDARMTLSGPPAPNALIRTRPELAIALKGPLGTPARSLDVTALIAWLNMRAAELQTRRIESIEANRRADESRPVVRPQPPTVRMAPVGTVVETEIPLNVPAAPTLGARGSDSRGLDRLLPEAPPTAPDAVRSETGTIERAAVPAAASPPPAVKPAAPPRPAPKPVAPAPAERSVLDFLFRPKN